MPSDANGVYSLPAGYLAVAGNTVLPSNHNPPLEDIAAALTARLSANGANAMTGPLKLADGLVGAPSLSFASAVGTGFYKTTAGIGVAVLGTRVAEFASGGLSKGARYIGELFPYVGTSPPPLCVFPVGQTLSRTTYADLWTFAQAEIAAGNTFFNNGDGSTTFGILDVRGRTVVARDTSGGVLTSNTMAPNGNTIGAKGGTELVYLVASQIPSITSWNLSAIGLNVVSTPKVVNGPNQGSAVAGGSQVTAADAGSGGSLSQVASTGAISAGNVVVTSNNTGGSWHSNMQPSVMTNLALFAGA
nr:hypothetical protein [uncultured Bradyrhizobium sp.]